MRSLRCRMSMARMTMGVSRDRAVPPRRVRPARGCACWCCWSSAPCPRPLSRPIGWKTGERRRGRGSKLLKRFPARRSSRVAGGFGRPRRRLARYSLRVAIRGGDRLTCCEERPICRGASREARTQPSQPRPRSGSRRAPRRRCPSGDCAGAGKRPRLGGGRGSG
jgi:hypothetical protein